MLVHAAAGGVGLLLGQWLKVLGATSIGTVGSPKRSRSPRPTATRTSIDYRAEDFVARVKEITGGKGCDVVYDSVGNDTWRGSLKCLKPRGMFVCFGQSSGMIADFKFSDLAAGGSLFATRPMLFDYIKSREDLRCARRGPVRQARVRRGQAAYRPAAWRCAMRRGASRFGGPQDHRRDRAAALSVGRPRSRAAAPSIP